MRTKTIHTTDYVLVEDEQKRKVGSYYVGEGFAGPNVFKWDNIKQQHFPNEFGNIIGHTPLNGAKELEEVPLLMEDSTYKWAENIIRSHHDFQSEGMSDYQNGKFNGLVEGYKAAQSNGIFTVSDLIKLVEFLRTSNGSPFTNYMNIQKKYNQEIISSENIVKEYLEQNSKQKEYVVDMKMSVDNEDRNLKMGNGIEGNCIVRQYVEVPKTTIINGKTYLVGEWEEKK